MAIKERYSTAVHSSDLTVDDKTQFSDTDVLGAMGLASKYLARGTNAAGDPVKPAPLAVPLERLLAGDNNAAHEVVRVLGALIFEQSWVDRTKIARLQCDDMAKACLAWQRDGRCQPCGGVKETLIPGTRTLSGHDCPSCRGTGKIMFEGQFRHEHQQLARWAIGEMDRAAGRAGPVAMQALAARMDF